MRKRFACFLAVMSVCVLVSACQDKLFDASCSFEGHECSSQLAVKSHCECDDCYICIDGHWKLDVWGLACGAPNAMRCLNGYSMVCKEGIWKADGNACCTSGETRCDNGVSQVCKTGVWVKGGSACDECTSGESRCDNGVSQVCVNGVWVNGGNACEECTSGATRCYGVSQVCKDGVWVLGGNACQVPCCGVCDEATYPGGCSDDLSRSYYCQNGQLVEKSCPEGKRCVIKGNNSVVCESTISDCAPGGTEYCNKACKSDKTEGYYYSNGKVHTIVCPNADCAIIDNKVMCSCADCSYKPCNKETYKSGCSDSLHGSYCNNKGIVVNLTCTDDEVCNNNDGYISCVSKTIEDCAPGGTKYCYKNCNSSKTEGYYYSKGEVHTIECPDADCEIRDNHVICGVESPCHAEDGYNSCAATNIPSSCEYGVSKGLCGADGMAYICGEEGKYYKNTKCTGNCYECGDGYWVACGEDEATACAGHDRPASDCSSQTLLTEGGNVGDCCDLVRYAPSCELMLRCDKTGHVAAIECKDNTTCVLNINGRKYNGYIYDQTKYPLGFYECI